MTYFDFSGVDPEDQTNAVLKLLKELTESVTDYPVTVEKENECEINIKIELPNYPMIIELIKYIDWDDVFGVQHCFISELNETKKQEHELYRISDYYDDLETEEEFKEFIEAAINEGLTVCRILKDEGFDFSNVPKNERADRMSECLGSLIPTDSNYPMIIVCSTIDDGFEYEITIESSFLCKIMLNWIENDTNSGLRVTQVSFLNTASGETVHLKNLENIIVKTKDDLRRLFKEIIDQSSSTYQELHSNLDE